MLGRAITSVDPWVDGLVLVSMNGNALGVKPADGLQNHCGVGVADRGVQKRANPFPYYGEKFRAHNKTRPTIFSAIPRAKKFPLL